MVFFWWKSLVFHRKSLLFETFPIRDDSSAPKAISDMQISKISPTMVDDYGAFIAIVHMYISIFSPTMVDDYSAFIAILDM